MECIDSSDNKRTLDLAIFTDFIPSETEENVEADSSEDKIDQKTYDKISKLEDEARQYSVDLDETLKEIKKLDLFTETLILTGHGSIDTALEAIKLGAYDYLTKPCEIDELVSKIEVAWGTKDSGEKKDMEEKIQKLVESPSAAFDLFPKDK